MLDMADLDPAPSAPGPAKRAAAHEPNLMRPEPAAILNVESDSAARSLLTRQLGRAGFQVLEAETGQGALDLLQKNPDLVLLGGVSGSLRRLEVCRRIKSDPQTRFIPVLYVSSTTRERTAAAEAGADEFLTRPFHDGFLVSIIRLLVRASRAESAARKALQGEREQLLRLVADERASLEEMVREMPAGVIIAEAPSGRLLLTNNRLEAILRGPFRIGGSSPDYLQYPAFHPDSRPYSVEQWPLARTVLTGEAVADEEIVIERGDHSRGTFLVSSHPVRNPEGAVIAAIMTLTDLTERMELEEQLRQAQKMEAMGRLAGSVAHDFNNLLTIIGGYGQMVLDSLDTANPLRRDLEAIMEGANRATLLTRQLLSFSRRQVLQPQVFDLNRHLSRMKRMLHRVMGEDVELGTTLGAKTSRILADAAQLDQVLLNIILNARDAMPTGGRFGIRTSDVELGEGSEPKSLKPGRYVLLSLSDTGLGMDAQTQKRAFEPFFTTKGKGKGTGLGLSTAYGIVKQSGGEIVIRSQLGSGTTVDIYFPVAEEAPVQPSPQTREPRRSGGTETVLVVEDDTEVLRLAAEMLSRMGYTVLTASSPAEALRIWEERGSSVDLVLSDVIMPQMSGPEMAHRLAAGRPGVKVLYMSGYTEEVIARHGVLNMNTGFVHKPFTYELLANKVRAALDRKTNL